MSESGDHDKKHEELANWYSQQKLGSGFLTKGHKSLITWLKISMSLMALLLLALLLIWPLVFTPEETFNLKFSEVSTDESETPVMLNPRFNGLDDKNQPYNLIAKEAVQEAEDIVYMKEVSGDITLDGGQWISLTAKEGRINMKNKKAKLMGDVNIISDDGFEFVTDRAYIDFGTGTASGDDPVVGQGLLGVLNATGFAITERGNTIIFSGPVKMVLYPDSGM